MYSVVLMMAMAGGGDVPAGLFGGHGCCGGCSGCYGCDGGCNGCHGCHGCHGSKHGCHGCHGSKHGCHGCYGSCSGCNGCNGCWGGMGYACNGGGCNGGGCYGAPMMGAPATGTPEKIKGPKTGLAPAPATIIVRLPAEARLLIDGAATTSTSTERVFVSPSLNPGREYHYTLKAEWARDGKPVTWTKEIAVRAGEETRVQVAAAALAEVASR